jgi:hypothetical protein
LKYKLEKLKEEEDYQIEKQKKEQKFSSGTKIPNHVKEITKYELKERIYNTSHSSILRIMTKWVEYLE